MKFSDIPAHEQEKERLRQMVDSDRIPHALLLEGPAGIGKFALARALAQYIHCSNRTPEGESCGTCPACLQHQTFNQPDTVFSFPILKSVSKEGVCDDVMPEWKEFLGKTPYMDFEKWLGYLNNPNGQPVIYASEAMNVIHKFSTTSYSQRYRILLMWLPERMQPECANKLLKMIEEPLPDSLLILVSDNPGEILPTIYSRLQRIKLRKLPDQVIAKALEAKGIDQSEAAAIAHLADGSMAEAARQLVTTAENHKFLEYFMDLMRSAYQRKIHHLRKWSVDISALGREGSISFLSYCERMMRENYIYNIGLPQLRYLNNAENAFSTKFAPFINERNVESLLREFQQARIDIAANGNAKIIFFDLAIKVILLLKR